MHLSHYARRLFLSLLLCSTAIIGWAQNQPHIGYLYPAGGKQGDSFTMLAGGQYLQGVTHAHMSGSGVNVTVKEYVKTLTPQQHNQLKQKIKDLLEKKETASATNVWTAADEKALAELRKNIAIPPNRQANPALMETVILEINVAADAEPGEHELRLRSPQGLTNPLLFHVGQLAESGEPLRDPRFEPPAKTNLYITLPCTINGQILPGESDAFRFTAHRGEHIVAATSARALMPYLADAVPGWFQATLTLYDAQGKEVAYADDYRFNPDPVLYYEIPSDGEYILQIRDAIYRGREDFVYRVTAGQLPFLTSIYPLGGHAGSATTLTLTGWNLPEQTMQITADESGPIPIQIPQQPWMGQRAVFSPGCDPEWLEQEPNNTLNDAPKVELTIIINGRIDAPGDQDLFRFKGLAGQSIALEVLARRLNSPLDSTLALWDATGKQMAFNDDCEDSSSGLSTHHADSKILLTLPSNGDYVACVRDAQHQGGPEYSYRLRIGPPQPDFELRLSSSSLNARNGSSLPITVRALRKDGFTNEITLELTDSPEGFFISGGRIPAGQDQIRCTLSTPVSPNTNLMRLKLQGRATIGNHEVIHAVVPADDMTQAFAYHHLVPARELLISLTGRWLSQKPVKYIGANPFKIRRGEINRISFTAPRSLASQHQFELSAPPEEISIKNVIQSQDGMEIELILDASKARPGLSGNLIIEARPQDKAKSNKTSPKANRRPAPVGYLPAVPFVIVE